jgi:hypothetical protein
MITFDIFFTFNFASLINKISLNNEVFIFSIIYIQLFECNGTN